MRARSFLERIEASELDVALAPPLPSSPTLAAGALERLPGEDGTDPYWRLVAAFLVGYPQHSSRAYFGDLKAWYGWCASSGVHPLAARRHHVDTWVRHLSQADQPATGRPASPASIARRLSCLSKFYDYGIKDAEVLEHSPVANVRGRAIIRARSNAWCLSPLRPIEHGGTPISAHALTPPSTASSTAAASVLPPTVLSRAG